MVPVHSVEDVQKSDLVLGLDMVAFHVVHDLRQTLGGADEGNGRVGRCDCAELGRTLQDF